MTSKPKDKLYYDQDVKADVKIKKISLKVIMITVSALLISYFFTTKNFIKTDAYALMIQTGKQWEKEDLKSNYNFTVPKKPEELEIERSEAEKNVPFYFTEAENIADSVKNIIENTLSVVPEEKKAVLPENLELDRDLYSALMKTKVSERIRVVKNMNKYMNTYINDIYSRGLINLPKDEINYEVIVVHIPPKDNNYYKLVNLYDLNEATKLYNKIVKSKFEKKHQEFLDYMFDRITIPNYSYNEELRNKAIRRAVDNITASKYIIHKNEILIAEGSVIDDEKQHILSEYFKIQDVDQKRSSVMFSTIGNIGHGLLLLLLIILYTAILRKDLWQDNFKVFMFLAFTVITVFLAWLTQRFDFGFAPEYLIFLPAFVLLITILIDARAAVIFALINGLMIAGIKNNDYILGTTYLIACGITAYSSRNLTNLLQTFQSIIIILIGFAVPIVFFGFETHAGTDFNKIAASAINAIASPALAFALLFVFDKMGVLWRFDTNLDLRVYDTKTHPMLKFLQDKAPGTYQHTLAVANISEACANAIGANPILTRVGAYYHDIGKSLKAECFTENQKENTPNKHNKLSPKQSAAIIKEHVTKGMDLAKQYGLPKKITDFITMHHGTSLIKHFYAKALEEYDKVDDSFYRYAGPKPQSKETAILMICDGAEAISRISDLTIEEIEEIIEQSIHEKILDGQLDESGITLGDLRIIQQVIAKTILGMIHQRTAYKKIPPKKPAGN